jgi:diguanylate cyclase (GGDEF)-like protein
MSDKSAEMAKPAMSIRLSNTPGLAEVDQFLAQAFESPTTVEALWVTPDKRVEFQLSVRSNQRGGEPEWRLSQSVDGKVDVLWTYVSGDMLLIHNLILTTCGEQHKSFAGEGKIIKSTDLYNQVYKMPATYQAPIEGAAFVPGKPPTRPPGTSHFEGELSETLACNLFNSIHMAGATGRLTIKAPGDEAEVFFADGKLLHARCREAYGGECVMVLCTWVEGHFRFDPDVRSDRKTVHQNIEKLLLKGVLLADKQRFLENNGVMPNSVLVCARRDLAEAEFESISAAAESGSYLSYDMTFQKQFYLAIDNKRTVTEVINVMGLLRSQWVPLLVRMIKCGFVKVQNPPADRAVRPKSIDRGAIRSVMTALKRPETGLLTYPAFLYFLEQEFLRHYRNNKPMSVVLIQIRASETTSDGTHQPLPPIMLGEAVRRISHVKRDVDYLAHYEMFDIAAILPNTKSEGAVKFTERVMKQLTRAPLDEKMGGSAQLSVCMGIATIPDDCKDLRMLLGSAEAALSRAELLNKNAVQFCHIAK